jgi:hypothetical protein
MSARVQLKRTSTPGAAPAASEFLPGELILQLADKKLFARDSSNTVFEVGFPRASSIRINGAINSNSMSSGDTPSGVETFDYGTPTNGSLVLIADQGTWETTGLWVYNTSGPWTRYPGWEIGSRHSSGILLYLVTASHLRLFPMPFGINHFTLIPLNILFDLVDYMITIPLTNGGGSGLTHQEVMARTALGTLI